jgi:putative nucleotidyltransferase with HDIG domain
VSEERYRGLVEGMHDGLAYCRMLYDGENKPVDWIYLAVNPAFATLTGLHDVIDRRVSDVLPEAHDTNPELFDLYGRVAAGGPPETIEVDFTPLGRIYNVSAFCPAPEHFVAIFSDITSRRQTAWEAARTLEFLAILNGSGGVEDLVRRAVEFVREHSACDAVGIRLHDGDDYPYYETRGFSAEFVRAECSLCAHDASGAVLLDERGDPVLECTCGAILSGRADVRLPYYTAQGSFWTNSTSALVEGLSEDDYPERSRGRCVTEGYESVMLIPLRAGREPVGLLQLDAKRANAFPEHGIAFWERLAGYLAGALGKMMAEARQRETAGRLERALDGTLNALGATVELRDPYTSGHERRVAALAVAIAGQLGWDDERILALRMAADIHDIGKIGVPAEILTKPTRLSEYETNIIRTHPQVGHDLLAGIEFEHAVADIVQQHHERLDGSGYPDGLRGDQILPEALVLSVADVVEAMASYRPYRPALGIEIAFEEIRDGAGTRYDPEVAAACEQAFAGGFAFPD